MDPHRVVRMDGDSQALAEWQATRLAEFHDQFKDRSDPSRRIWHPQSESTGQLAEMAFSMLYDLPPHLELTSSNDGRVDFVVNGHEVDIKGARFDYGLAREVDKWHCEVLVLGLVDHDENTVTFPGWEFDAELVKLKPRQIRQGGIFNHAMPSSFLKPMYQLEDYLGITPKGT